MGQFRSFRYLHPSEAITEGSTYRFPAMTLYDEKGAIIPGTSLMTMVLTLYAPDTSLLDIVANLEQTDIKNDGQRGSINSSGVFTLTLLPADTIIVTAMNRLERRIALIEYTYASGGAKADAIEIEFVIKNLARRPYVAP
jgi:hypothetical protein